MEARDHQPEPQVQAAEYLRLLGYPHGHEPGDRVKELMAWARDWYAQHGRPWAYQRRVALRTGAGTLRLDGVPFASPQLRAHLHRHGAQGALLVAVSAGRECEEQARKLWEEGKPDEYFFLEMFGSAVVEDLVARTSGRLCAAAGQEGLRAVPHYSPGYTGWDVADQNKLFDLMTGGMSGDWPGPLEVLSSGMLRPKKSLLAVFGLAPAAASAAPPAAPCEGCSFSPCRYRRAAYRHAHGAGDSVATPAATAGPPARAAGYTVNARALRKWAGERVRLSPRGDGTLDAVFRFDGTTCSNLGRPLAFDYRVRLSGPDRGDLILESQCAPAADDEGHQYTCAYLGDPDRHRHDLAADRPLLGRPLAAVLGWDRAAAPAGCPCTAGSRAHNWGLALEAIHYALARSRQLQPVT